MSAIQNVVVVVIDALRADRVGVLGSSRELTPHLDALASNSTVFTSAFSCTNATDPSITSFITGCHPRRSIRHHGKFITQAEKQRVEAFDTLPELLQQADIQTVATGRPMGRWHTRGYDGHPHASESTPTLYRAGEMLNRIHPRLRSMAAAAYRAVSGTVERDETSATTELLDRLGEGQSFGFVHLMDTHTPYADGDELIAELLDTHDYPEGDLEPILEELGDAPLANSLQNWFTDADYDRGIARVCARYDASVFEADRKLGTFVETLEQRGELDETALFVLSDHGESLIEHGIYFDHHGLYDESIHIPLVCHLPGTAGDTVDELVQIPDLMPTILELFDVPIPDGIDGQPLQPLLRDEGEWESRDAVFAEEAHTQHRVALRTDEWKLIDHRPDERLESLRGSSLKCGYCGRRHDDPPELFDLVEDPGEQSGVTRLCTLK